MIERFEDVFEIACPVKEMNKTEETPECSLWRYMGYSSVNFDRNIDYVPVRELVIGKTGKNPHQLQIPNDHPTIRFANKMMIVRFNGVETCDLDEYGTLKCGD